MAEKLNIEEFLSKIGIKIPTDVLALALEQKIADSHDITKSDFGFEWE